MSKARKKARSKLDDAVDGATTLIPEPSVNTDYRRLFTPPDVPELAETPPDQLYTAKDSKVRRDVILGWLRAGWSKNRACIKAGISTATLRDWRKKDVEFDQQVREAIDDGTDVCEDVARHRAIEGVAKPVYQQGTCVGYVVEHSDALLMQQLAGRRPDKYGKQKLEHSGADGEPLKVTVEFVKPKDA